jgi:predicted DNA-binding transcriptional regulator YafY
MRHDKAQRLLTLARLLAGTAEGLTLDEMAARLAVGRRTVERMRDAVREVFPQMEDIDDPPTRRFRIPSGLDGLFQAPTAEELAALRTATEALASSGAQNRAAALTTLEAKLMAAMRPGVRRRLAPDVEALMQAETIAVQAGPRPFEEDQVLALIREAIKSLRAMRLRYDGGSTPGRLRTVVPFGLLFGRSNYLVAAELGPDTAPGPPRNWRLDRMAQIEVLDLAAAPPEDFSLQDYADQSFGIYQDDVGDVVLRVLPHGAEDALRWRFHTHQTVTREADGAVTIRFRASGMTELSWHLFSWGDKVQILAPERLRAVMAEQLRLATSALGSGSGVRN